MAIRILRSTTTATPESLSEGQLAYSENSENLFIGTSGATQQVIGGLAYTTKVDGIEAGANLYVHPTGDGNLHVPATGGVTVDWVLTNETPGSAPIWKVNPVGVTDHTGLSSIGTNSHAQIDTHIAIVSGNPHGVTYTDVGADMSGTDNSIDVTLVGTGGYLSLVAQELTKRDLVEADITDLQAYIVDISASSIDELNDVDTTTSAPAGNELLMWDTSNWVPANLTEAGISPSGHNHDAAYEPINANIQTHISATDNPHGTTVDLLDDTAITSAADDDVLSFNTTGGNWENKTLAGAGIAAATHLHTGTYEPAAANIQAHIGTVIGNPHAVTFAELSDAPTSATWNHNLLTGLQGGAASDYYHVTNAELLKLQAIEAGAQVNTVDTVAGKTGDVLVVAGDLADWEASVTTSLGSNSVGTLSDVSIGTPATGEVLKWSGSAWSDEVLAAAEVSYDGTTAGLVATNVKTAIDEVAAANAVGVVEYGALAVDGGGDIVSDINTTDFSFHEYSLESDTFLTVLTNHIVTFGNGGGTAYRYFGPKNVTIGSGGAYTVLPEDLQASGTDDHSTLQNRSVADAHPIAAITGLQTALDAKSDDGHGHVIADTTGLQTALDAKVDDGTTYDFVGLTDTPANFVGASNYHVKVNAAGNALEFLPDIDDGTF